MAADAALALPPAAPPARPRVLLIGTALASAAAFMVIVGMLGVYLSARSAVLAEGATWLPDGANLPLTPGTIAFATMLLSAVTMAWAVYSVGNNDRPMAYLALGLTIFFGLAVINATSFLYTEVGLAVTTETGLLFYAVTGTHIAMIIAGLVFASVMTIRTLGGEYHGRDREGLVAAALFWYVTIAAMAPIWYAIYITK
jgi:heme/copper-type cytochrome/quinol oxidase subunit 3